MVTEIKLPQYAMGLSDGMVVRWLKAVGDPVDVGEEIAEIEEAKVTQVLISPVKGILKEVLVKEGEVVPVRTVLCTIDSEGSHQEFQPKGITAVEEPVSIKVTDEESKFDRETIVSMTGMRETIARRMSDSLLKTAQFSLYMQADITDLLNQREALKTKVDNPVRVTITDIIIKACALKLKDHPRLNGWSEDDQIRLVSDVHMGLAVALEEGLIVPVLRNADQKSLRAIAEESKELAAKAVDNTLSTGEVTGSTFTITNLGMMGVSYFTPIINLPEVAILGVGSAFDYPMQQGDGAVWRKGLPLSLTIDHKAVDGAPAALFLRDLKDCLEKIDLTKL